MKTIYGIIVGGEVANWVVMYIAVAMVTTVTSFIDNCCVIFTDNSIYYTTCDNGFGFNCIFRIVHVLDSYNSM